MSALHVAVWGSLKKFAFRIWKKMHKSQFAKKVDELLSTIYAHEKDFRSVPAQAARQLAAAGLMRCCALLRAVRLLEESGLGVIAGVLERAHWETWLVSLHVLLGGEEAIQKIAGDDIYWKRVLAKKFDLGAYHDDWKGKVEKLNVWKLSEDLKPLMIAAGEEGNPDGTTAYDITFRVQSLFAAHACLSSFGHFMDYGDKEWRVVAEPPPQFPVPAPTPALNTAHLARYVFKAFGLAEKDLEQIGDELLEMVKANQAKA